MTLERSVATLGLAAVTTLAGCTFDTTPRYHIDDYIGDTHFHFNEERQDKGPLMGWVGNHRLATLTVTRPDGKVITYVDRFNNQRLDTFEVTLDGRTETFERRNPVERPVVKREEATFKGYLKQIEEHNKNAELARADKALS